jgi:Family of unknown function (DUF6178)
LSRKLSLSQGRSLRDIVDNPALPIVLGHMQPRTLARLIDRIGLHDAAELMALVPTRNLLRALDEAVWKSSGPGVNQVFDPAEFVHWLEVWADVGESFIASRLAAINDEYLAMCLSSVLLVDSGSRYGFGDDMSDVPLDDQSHEGEYTESPNSDCHAIYGHFLLRPAFADDWEIIKAALDALWRHAPDRLLHLLGTLVSSESMLTSERRRNSLNLDVAFERERYRERRGYVSPAGARAFLVSTSIAATDVLLEMSGYDNETLRFLSGLENDDASCHPIDEVLATDSTDDEWRQTQDQVNGLESTPPPEEQIMSLSRLLENEAIVEPRRFESLPSAKQDQGRSGLATLLNRLEAENQQAFQQRTRELAYLATVLMAGSSLEGESFTGGEARDAALATCNLGLEYLQSKNLQLRLDREPELIRLFSIGWRLLGTLRGRVIESMKASLTDAEAAQPRKISPWLRNEAQIGIRDLQSAVEQQRFADARDAATFLSIVFDATACQEIAFLLDHLPHFASQPRWIGSIADFDQVGALLADLSKK